MSPHEEASLGAGMNHKGFLEKVSLKGPLWIGKIVKEMMNLYA